MIVAPTAPDRIILLAYKHLFNSLIENIPGIPIRSNLSDEDTENYAALVSQLAIKAHHVVRYQTLRKNDYRSFITTYKDYLRCF